MSDVEPRICDDVGPRPVRLDGENRIDDDCPCRYCRYNLRGISAESQCPECGKPIRLSRNPEVLRWAPKRWLRRLRLGIVLIVLSGLSAAALDQLGPYFLPPTRFPQTFGEVIRPPWWQLALGVAGHHGLRIACLIGAMFFTARAAHPGPAKSASRRIAFVAACANIPLELVALMPNRYAPETVHYCLTLRSSLDAVVWVAVLTYAARLFALVPAAWLSRLTKALLLATLPLLALNVTWRALWALETGLHQPRRPFALVILDGTAAQPIMFGGRVTTTAYYILGADESITLVEQAPSSMPVWRPPTAYPPAVDLILGMYPTATYVEAIHRVAVFAIALALLLIVTRAIRSPGRTDVLATRAGEAT